MIPIILSKMQLECVASICKWFKSSKMYYVLAGFAGTGKTFIIRHVIDKLGIEMKFVAFATFTGKAALVMTQKANGDYECQTLHRLLYRAEVDYKGNLTFVKKGRDNFRRLKLIVIDECSMVSAELLQDLYDVGVKILFVGDHGQLPPVGMVSNIYKRLSESPDFCLTEIHRQAEGSPIIYLSMLAREGKAIPYGKYADSGLVIHKSDIGNYIPSMLAADVVICGKNITRTGYNNYIRKEKGFTDPFPMVGEKLICLKNNWNKCIDEYNLVNGMIGYVNEIKHLKDYMEIVFKPEFTKSTCESRLKKTEFLNGKADDDMFSRETDLYAFGYAITCHKSQGSQWEKAFVVNEVLRVEDHKRWLYTAITRASEKLILAL